MNFRSFSLFFQVITALIYETLYYCESKTVVQKSSNKNNDITTPITHLAQQLSSIILLILIHFKGRKSSWQKKSNESFLLLLHFISKCKLRKIRNNCSSSFTSLIWFDSYKPCDFKREQ